MNKIEKYRWTQDYGESLSIDMLRERYTPKHRHRVVEHKFPSGESIHGSMISGKFFVIQGSMKYIHLATKRSVLLTAGDWAELPESRYVLEVGDTEDVRFFTVHKIPDLSQQL